MMSEQRSGKAIENSGPGGSEGVDGENKGDGAEAGDKQRGKGESGEELADGAGEDERSNDNDDEKQGRDMGKDGGGGFETVLDCMPLVHVGRSFRMAFGLALTLGTIGAICPVSWEVVVSGGLLYPVSGSLFYFASGRSGARSGPPVDMMPASLALLAVGTALLVSGSAVLGGLFSVALAMAVCGMSTGQWLAVVAERRKTGLRGAVWAVWQLDGVAREQARQAIVEGRL